MEGKLHAFAVDTGCDVSTVPLAVARAWDVDWYQLDWCSDTWVAYASVEIDGHIFRTCFQTSTTLASSLLGYSFL